MRKPFYFSGLITLGVAVSTAFGASAYEIKKFRFSRHNGLNFERLVLEFGERGGGFGAPNVRLGQTKEGQTLVTIERANLIGAIPEASINDSYVGRSKYFGPINISTEMKDGFYIRTAVKNPEARVDAFWLQYPSRLIVDVFPQNSERALGAHVVGRKSSRNVANLNISKTTAESTSNNVLCFTANAQVRAMLGYELGDLWRGIQMTVNDLPELQAKPPADNIVCFPKGAQVMPMVTFSAGGGLAKLEFKPMGGLPLISEPRPPVSVKEGPKPASVAAPVANKEVQLNREADLLLGLPSDNEIEGARGAGPVGNVNPWEDNFNKNAPPPTLGKSLLPPSAGGAQRPTLAGPGSLLPPVK